MNSIDTVLLFEFDRDVRTVLIVNGRKNMCIYVIKSFTEEICNKTVIVISHTGDLMDRIENKCYIACYFTLIAKRFGIRKLIW